jgi:hypothetical protein
MGNVWMSLTFQIRALLVSEFTLFNCAGAACTIMQRSVAQFKTLGGVFIYG